MNKLSLDLDQLTVESFDTSERTTEKGTVFGEQCTCYTNCTCPGCPSCDTCNNCGSWDLSCTCPTEGWYSCGPNCNTNNDPTCDPSSIDPRTCCPG